MLNFMNRTLPLGHFEADERRSTTTPTLPFEGERTNPLPARKIRMAVERIGESIGRKQG